MYMADNMQQFKEKLSHACKAGPHVGKTHNHSEIACVQCSRCGVRRGSSDCGASKAASSLPDRLAVRRTRFFPSQIPTRLFQKYSIFMMSFSDVRLCCRSAICPPDVCNPKSGHIEYHPHPPQDSKPRNLRSVGLLPPR